MEKYSAMKRHKLLIHKTMWMNLKIITLSKKKATHTKYILYNSSYIKL